MATGNAKAPLNERHVVDARHSAGVAQLVERNLPKVDVAGSTPVIRSLPPHVRVGTWFPVRHTGRRSPVRRSGVFPQTGRNGCRVNVRTAPRSALALLA